MSQLTDDQLRAITNLILEDKKIEAIKVYREATGESLLEAKTQVENIARDLAKVHPELMKARKKGCAVLAIFVFILLGAVALIADDCQVYKSTDKGKTWSRSGSGLPGHARINAFTSIGNVVLAGTDSGIFVSSGDVANWTHATNDLEGSTRVVCLASIATHVFAGTDGEGILLSEDAAGSWSRLSTLSSAKIRCMAVQQETLFVGTESDGVFKSDDFGQSWKRLSTGFPIVAQVFAMTVGQGELFAALYGQGLHHWRRDTQQWKKVGAVTPLVLAMSGNHLVVGHNPGGIQWSDDLGVHWYAGLADVNCGAGIPLLEQPQHLTSDAPVWEMASLGNLVFAGALDGIYYSNDRGRTWTRAITGLPEESPGVSFLLTDEFILAAITEAEASQSRLR